MSLQVKNITHRTELVLGRQALELLSTVRVIIFGVGGVGSWCAEALVRTGVLNLTIVDADIICITNVNRQLQATSQNVGRVKVEELAARLQIINPAATITAINRAYDEISWPSFALKDYDFVIDAIDSMNNKVLLIEQAQAAGRPVLFSSMGAAVKMDATKIRVARLEKTHVCPLAKHVRRRLRERDVATGFLCVYSDEQPVTRQIELPHEESSYEFHGAMKRTNGSLVHITGVFGFMLAGLVVQEVRRRAEGLGIQALIAADQPSNF